MWEGSDDEREIPDDGVAAHSSADAILRDFRYKIQCMYMEPARDLRVPCFVMFCFSNLFSLIELSFLYHKVEQVRCILGLDTTFFSGSASLHLL